MFSTVVDWQTAVKMRRSHLRNSLLLLLVFVVCFMSLYNPKDITSANDYDDMEDISNVSVPKPTLSTVDIKVLVTRWYNSTVLDHYYHLGYSLCDATSLYNPWLCLKPSANSSCNFYFDTSYSDHSQFVSGGSPPAFVPINLESKYSMNGLVDMSQKKYFDDRYNGVTTPYQWNRHYLNRFMYKAEILSIDFNYYSDTDAVYFTLQQYNLTGQSGMVFGSENPWLEAILLVHGKVAKITTVEYHLINSSVPQLAWIHPQNLSENWRETAALNLSFAFSFSSFEHSGLGRYGDPLNPDGDLLELRKISCLLPVGSLVFLGVPIGPDKLVWNAHRIYGPFRLPLLTANYELLSVFSHRGKVANLWQWMYERSRDNSRSYKHFILVLRNKGCR